MSWLSAIRLGAAIALLAPLVYFIASFLLHGGSWGEFPLVLVTGALNSVLDLIAFAITNPLKAMIFIAISWVAGHLAFGR